MPMSAPAMAELITTNIENAFSLTLSTQQRADMVTTWTAVCSGIISHMNSNARISLGVGNIPVNPGTFTAGSTSVTGQGENAAVNLDGKIS